MPPTIGTQYDLLRSYRPTLHQSAESMLSLGNGFGFHPNLQAFKSLYDEGALLPILSVGYKNMSRSHEDAEVAYARGVSDRFSPASSGYLNRLGSAYQWHSLQAVRVSGTDRAFEGGDYRGVQVEGLESYYFNGDYSVNWEESLHRRDMLYAISTQWSLDPQKTSQANAAKRIELTSNSTEAIRRAIDAATFTQAYPRSEFGEKFRDVDILFSASSLGTQVGYIRRGGFDSHSDQRASIDDMLTEFSSALSVFVSNMKAKNLWNKLIIMVISEFGRTNRENRSFGTDHGGAVPLFLSGGLVREKQIIGEIQTTDLTDNGWLPMRHNVVDIYRQVFAQMGYDPDRAFEPSNDELILPRLFV